MPFRNFIGALLMAKAGQATGCIPNPMPNHLLMTCSCASALLTIARAKDL